MPISEEKINQLKRDRLSDDGGLLDLPPESVSLAKFNYHGDALRLKDPIKHAALQRNILQTFVQSQMIDGTDYGKVAQVPKPFLFKQGAEKLLTLFNYGISIESVRHIEDFDKPFFHYVYLATVRDRTGFVLAQCEGSCNSKEKAYQSDKVDLYGACNSIMKKAEKRSFVGAVLLATNASGFFENPAKEQEMKVADSRPTWDIDAEVVEDRPALITDGQRKRFWAIANKSGYTKPAVKVWLSSMGIESTSNIETNQYELLCKQAENPDLAKFWNTQSTPSLD
jgi:hypothetical protein